MGKLSPEKNFIGIDIKGNRIWYGAKEAIEEDLLNVHFLRTRIDFITAFFAKDEIDEIWITFPDPQEKGNRARKRLSGKMFVDRYRKFLKPEGVIHLKQIVVFYMSLHNKKLLNMDTKNCSVLQIYMELILNDSKNQMKPVAYPNSRILTIKTYYEELFSARGAYYYVHSIYSLVQEKTYTFFQGRL